MKIQTTRKIAHRDSKNFGYHDDKGYRGAGRFGLARSYGHNNPNYSDHRTRRELINRSEIRVEQEDLQEIQ